jgi:hypothetical protein
MIRSNPLGSLVRMRKIPWSARSGVESKGRCKSNFPTAKPVRNRSPTSSQVSQPARQKGASPLIGLTQRIHWRGARKLKWIEPCRLRLLSRTQRTLQSLWSR